MEKKYVVPEGMLKTAQGWAKSHELFGTVSISGILEAAIRWLAENPIEPSTADTLEMLGRSEHIANQEHEYAIPSTTVRRLIAEWQRRMFLASEPAPESAYTRVIKAMGAATLTPREGEIIIEYVKGAIHNGLHPPDAPPSSREG